MGRSQLGFEFALEGVPSVTRVELAATLARAASAPRLHQAPVEAAKDLPPQPSTHTPERSDAELAYALELALRARHGACGASRLFERLCRDVLGRPDLNASAAFATNADRNAHRDDLFAALNAIFGQATRDHWLAKMRQAGVPAGAVRTLVDAFASPEMAARERVKKIPHAAVGEVPNIGSPLHLRGTPVVAAQGAPTLGQHTEAVLKEFGYSDAELAELSRQGAFGRIAKKDND